MINKKQITALQIFIKPFVVAIGLFSCYAAIAQTATDSLQLRSGGNLVKLLAQPSTAAYSIQLPAVVPAKNQFLGISSVTGTTGIGAWMDSTAFKNTYWSLTGNSGTIAGTNFLGTTDAQDLVLKTNNTENLRINHNNGYVGIGTVNPVNTLEVSASSNPLKLDGLQPSANATTDSILIADINGVVKKSANVAGPRWFYMPSIPITTSSTGTGLTKDLYGLYASQFSGPAVRSSGAPGSIPYIPAATSLYYYVTSYDASVFANVSIDASGSMKYDIISTATPASYINIVFVVK